jgi:hypothetical protein
MADMHDEVALAAALQPFLEKVLAGYTVKLGVFNVREDFIYTRDKEPDGRPKFNRVISLVYFDEDEDDNPSLEQFDGTMERFVECLDAHAALLDYEDTSEIGEEKDA